MASAIVPLQCQLTTQCCNHMMACLKLNKDRQSHVSQLSQNSDSSAALLIVGLVALQA